MRLSRSSYKNKVTSYVPKFTSSITKSSLSNYTLLKSPENTMKKLLITSRLDLSLKLYSIVTSFVLAMCLSISTQLHF